MKFRILSTLALTSTVLSSCIYYTQPVPEMPYSKPGSQPSATVQQPNNAAYAAATQYAGAWSTSQPTMLPTANPYSSVPTGYVGSAYTPTGSQVPILAPLPASMAVTTPATTPATIPAPAAAKPATATTAITQPQIKLNPVTPKPAVAVKPAEAPKPTTPAPASAPKDPKTITNTGPIPVATPVPGDPTRVYNPLDSSKTIRITDKNGKIYPSGKELKVRGTNFHFYVP